MANTYTPYYSLTKPEVGGDTNAWGGHLNGNFDVIDATLKELADAANGGEGLASAALPKTGGTMTGAIVFAASQPLATTSTPGVTRLIDTWNDASVNLAPTARALQDIINIVRAEIARATPPGALAPFARTTAPEGWLAADGSAVSRTTYAALFAAIGTTFGAGNGSTTFNLPDARGVVMRGVDNGRGLDPSRAFGSYQADAFGYHDHAYGQTPHAHSISDPGHYHTTQGYFTSSTGNYASGPVAVGGLPNVTSSGTYGAYTGISVNGAYANINFTGQGGTETRMKNLAALICIKY